MRSIFPVLSLVALTFAVLAMPPGNAFANDRQKIREALARQPFRDLPGVKLPQKVDDEPQTVCTSRIGRDFWGEERTGAYVPRLTRRIYSCDVDNVTIESTRRPDEIDWKKQKRYYKPWIDDGFDRDR